MQTEFAISIYFVVIIYSLLFGSFVFILNKIGEIYEDHRSSKDSVASNYNSSKIEDEICQLDKLICRKQIEYETKLKALLEVISGNIKALEQEVIERRMSPLIRYDSGLGELNHGSFSDDE